MCTAALFSLVVAGCQSGAGVPKEAESAPPAQGQETRSEEALAEDEQISDEEAELLAQIESEAALADAEAQAELQEDSDGAREVVYRVSPEGMRVQIGDAEFTPYAVAIRAGAGWGVRLTVEAKADTQMVLYAPNQGPLAFGGKVTGQDVKKFGDKREGGSEVLLQPGQPVSFSRTWPEPGKPGLLPGQRLELHVGLWGLGATSDDRRPVARFAVVKMAASSSGAQPIIEPPAQ